MPAHLVGSAIGFATMFGELIGGFLAPLAGGALAERHGLALPLWMAAAGAAVVLLSALGMRVRNARGAPDGRDLTEARRHGFAGAFRCIWVQTGAATGLPMRREFHG